MNIFSSVKSELSTIAADQLKDKGYDASWLRGVTVEPPRDASHGDMATNIAMVMAGRAKMKPRDFAESVAEKLTALDDIEKVEVAGPGFINMTLAPSVWQSHIKAIIRQGVEYGSSELGANKKVNIEYVSANPTGPMHIGHARGAVVGDALASLYQKAGYDVVREYYINDAGSQIDVLAKSALLRYREALGEDIGAIPEGLYPGDYLVPVGEKLFKEYGKKLAEMDEKSALDIAKPFAIAAMMDMIRSDLKELGVEHNIFTSEKSLHDADAVTQGLKELEALGLIYKGVLEPPKGKLPDDWEAREQTLFKSTEFGDDVDRALAKSDGSWTYFAADVAYTKDKLSRGFEQLVMILGADHGGYVKRMKAIVKALSKDAVSLDIQLCQLVKFMEDGVAIKMSKRAGTFTTVRDVVEAVGKDVVRFIMLTRKPEQPLDFDLKKVTEKSKENPVFYVQYAHARCQSILRMSGESMPNAKEKAEALKDVDVSQLNSDAELQLMQLLASWPRMVEAAAIAGEPHRVAYYLQEVAASFHGLWNKGNDDAHFRFIIEQDEELTAARLVLIQAVATVIASALSVLGVTPVDEMR